MNLYDLAYIIENYIEVTIVDTKDFSTKKDIAYNLILKEELKQYEVLKISPLNDDQMLIFIK